MADKNSSGFPKQTLKRVEIHLNKFNEVAIPHHVDLLKKHKYNIERFQEAGDWERIYREQINATRLVKQLKALLYEMDMLRNQVQDADLPKFDKLTANARKNALDALKEYLDMNPQRLSPVWLPTKSPMDGNATGDESHITNPIHDEVAASQLRLSLSKEEVEKQEACLKSWERLQTEVQDIHSLFNEFAQVVETQKEDVETVESHVETAQENVHEGERLLLSAARYNAAVYPLAGAIIGGCLGGPIGLVAGVKLGGLTALGCGFLGFTGGRFLKKRQEKGEENEVELTTINQDRNVKGSISLPTLVETNSKQRRGSSEDPLV